MKNLYAILTVLTLVALAGCESVPISTDFMLAPLEGKIFDNDNTPCSDVLVTIDKGASVRSDINGRFVLTAVGKGKHEITATKEGYESFLTSFSFLNRNQILWIRMISLKQIERKIEAAFDDEKWEDAENLIDRALKVKDNDPVILYLQALLFDHNGWFDQSLEVLARIVDGGHGEATIFLTMADICEYKLKDKARAIQYLEKYLEMKTDDSAFKRIEALKKSE